MRKLLILFCILFIPAFIYANETTVDGLTAEPHIVQDEGTSLPPRGYLDFQGAGVAASTSGNKTIVVVPSATAISGWTDGGTSVYLTTSTDIVGIGITDSAYKLNVVGNIKSSGTISSANLFVTGNLGVGTSSPLEKLNVVGNIITSAGGWFIAYEPAGSEYAAYYHDGGGAVFSANSGNISLLAPGGSNIELRVGDTTGTNKLSIQDSGNSEVASIDSNGNIIATTITSSNLFVSDNVGIGTTNPLSKLHVVGNILSSGTIAGNILTGTNVTSGLDPGHTHGSGSITEVDPVVKALTGIITSNGSAISSTTDNHTNWDTAYSNRILSATAPSPLILTIAGNTLAGSILQAGTSASGYLSVGDWNTFSLKADYLFGANNFSGTGNITASTGTLSYLQVNGDANVTGDLYVTDVFVTNIAGNSYVLGNFGIGNSAPINRLQIGTTPNAPLFVVKDSGNVGIGTTNPLNKLKIIGDIVADTGTFTTLQFGTSGLNILPAGTGANNQILKTNASGVVTWQADADTGATGVQSVSAVLPLSSTGGTAPSISLAVDNITMGTNPSNQLIVKDAGIDLTTKVSGTLPAANMTIIDLTSMVSGTLPSANTITIPLASKVSGTLPAANMTVVDLNSGMVSGTLPNANMSIVPLGTKVSGTLPDASSPLNINNTTITSGTGTFTRLITTTLKTSDTIPLARLYIQEAKITSTGPMFPLSLTKNYTITKLIAQSVGVGATNVIFTLREVGADGTTPLYNLAVGQTAPVAPLILTTFTGGTVPAGNFLVIDITAVNGGATAPSMPLSIHGVEY